MAFQEATGSWLANRLQLEPRSWQSTPPQCIQSEYFLSLSSLSFRTQSNEAYLPRYEHGGTLHCGGNTGRDPEHLPRLHIPVSHAAPHDPQLFGSFSRSTQVMPDES
jgi:hypothetical protein